MMGWWIFKLLRQIYYMTGPPSRAAVEFQRTMTGPCLSQ